MILYFSGTGNSEYVAKRIAQANGEPLLNLFEKIKENDFNSLSSPTPWIVVTPTYAWRIPKILHNWLKHTELKGHKKLYFVMTCGGNNGNADKYLMEMSRQKGMEYQGCCSIVMPENYIALFSTPAKKEALHIIEQAEGSIDRAVSYIKAQKPFPTSNVNLKDKINSGIIHTLYYPLLVHAKNFYVEDSCISCGKCVEVCPLKNIHLVNGKPVWGKNCTHCMACINHCPKEAIEYGKKTKNRVRYTCPK